MPKELISLIIIAILFLLVIVFFKRFDSIVYFVCLADILLRILNFIANNLGVYQIKDFILSNFPSSFVSVISSYTSGTLTTILLWVLLGLYCVFFGLVTRTFFRKL